MFHRLGAAQGRKGSKKNPPEIGGFQMGAFHTGSKVPKQHRLAEIFEYLYILPAPVVPPIRRIRKGPVRRPGRQDVACNDFFGLLLAQHGEGHVGFEML